MDLAHTGKSLDTIAEMLTILQAPRNLFGRKYRSRTWIIREIARVAGSKYCVTKACP